MMSRPPDYMHKMSEKLSEVMDDIGVNTKIVMERRRALTLKETLQKFCKVLFENGARAFIFGSQIEGSTTIDLNSDMDILICADHKNVIQHMCELKCGNRASGLVVQNEYIPPGYCCIQAIGPDIPCPATANNIEINENNTIDSKGRIPRRNTSMFSTIVECGPAIKRQGVPGEIETDIVAAYFCKSSPLQAAPWLDKLTESKWPSEDDKRFCRNAGCFVVTAGSKLSDIAPYEGRISTSLQERCLMFSLNITQLRCYVLMKMILITHIHPYVKDVLSSFMCKNVLLYCVYNSSHESSQDWDTGNLLSYLHLCLFMLKECILQRNCPHLMIPGNDLLAGRMTDAQRGQLLDIIDKLMEDKEELLYKIQIDDLSMRLKMKITEVSLTRKLPSAINIASFISFHINTQIAATKKVYVRFFLQKWYNKNLKVTQQNMSESLTYLKKTRNEGDSMEQSACDHLISLVKSALGSVMACISIDAQAAISDEAFAYLEAGREFKALSGSLKLVSVLYCTGDIDRAECELKNSQQLNNVPIVESLPCCFPREPVFEKVRFFKACDDHKEEAIKFLLAVCTIFLNNEINCVPHELSYEILRSYIEEDRKIRTVDDSRWMDHIAVDSVPYLYFLLYKTYGRLQKGTEQQEALSNLVRIVETQPDLNHKETTLNLIGQCMEQENLQAAAIEYYIRSLQQRERNNAARFLLCIQLMKLWKKYNL